MPEVSNSRPQGTVSYVFNPALHCYATLYLPYFYFTE